MNLLRGILQRITGHTEPGPAPYLSSVQAVQQKHTELYWRLERLSAETKAQTRGAYTHGKRNGN